MQLADIKFYFIPDNHGSFNEYKFYRNISSLTFNEHTILLREKQTNKHK